jgi:hypothetical protein
MYAAIVFASDSGHFFAPGGIDLEMNEDSSVDDKVPARGLL